MERANQYPERVKSVDLPAQFEGLRSEILRKISEECEAGNFILTPELKTFEENFARYCGCKYSLGVANGTDALFLIMKALNIGKGDEVITPPNSFIATAGAIIAAGAKPVFVDVKEDFNIDPDLIEKAITEKTKAILPVHLTGRPADMKPITEIAERHNLLVIEDAAQAAGARYYGRRTGSLGIAAGFSLHPLKALGAYGDGGVVTTNNEEIIDTITKLRNHGLRNRDEADLWGYNSRLDGLQAAIVNIKLKHLEEWNQKSRAIAEKYRRGLSNVVEVPVDKPFEEAAYHTFVIQCDNRDELQNHLLKKGIKTRIHYPIPIHLQKPARALGYKEGDFPVAEQQAKRILSLPIYPKLTDEQIQIVIEEIKAFYD